MHKILVVDDKEKIRRLYKNLLVSETRRQMTRRNFEFGLTIEAMWVGRG